MTPRGIPRKVKPYYQVLKEQENERAAIEHPPAPVVVTNSDGTTRTMSVEEYRRTHPLKEKKKRFGSWSHHPR